MSYTNDQWRLAVTNLLKKTSKNELRWELSQFNDVDAWTTVDRSLQASLDDKLYVVHQVRTKHYLDEDVFSWQGGFAFSIYEEVGPNQYEKIATAPELSSLVSLFEAAENNMAFNRDALDGLLG